MKKCLLLSTIIALSVFNAFSQFAITGSGSQTVCAGTIDTVSITATGGTAPYQYAWQNMGDTLACDTCANTTFTATRSSTFYVTVTDSNGNQLFDTIHYNVITASAHVTTSGADTFCQGKSVTLSTNATDSLYQWQLNGNNIAGATSRSYVVADSAGSYQLLVTTNGGCTASSNTVQVGIVPTISAHIVSADTISLCAGSSVTLQANFGFRYDYQWVLDGRILSQDSGLYVITASLGGLYHVIESGDGYCSDTSNNILVNIRPLPVVYFNAFAGDTLCSNAAAITLSGGNPGGGTYAGSGVTTDSVFNPSLAPVGDNIITYTYTGDNGCPNSAYEHILVEACTGIDNLNEGSSIMVYPNPANEVVMLQGAAITGIEKMPTVFDIDGRAVDVAFERTGDIIKINTTQLSNGVYIARLFINGTVINKRFIKARQ